MVDWTSWLSYGFMRSALIAILIITPLFGILGTLFLFSGISAFLISLIFHKNYIPLHES